MNANGLYSGLDGGAVNGVYNGVNGGVGNGAVSNETKPLNTIPLLDSFPNAAAAYSLRKLRKLYNGPAIRVRRSSDSTEQDIGFDVNSNLSESQLRGFVGTSDGLVSVWYDQSEQGRNASQANPIFMPRIVLAGTIERLNNRISIFWTNAGGIFLRTATISPTIPQPFTFFSVGRLSAATGINASILFDNAASGNFTFYSTGTTELPNNTFRLTAGTNIGNVTQNANTNLFYGLLDTTNSAYSLNNDSEVTGNAGTNQFDGLTIGMLRSGATGSAYDWSGYISELILYNSNRSSNKISINSNINSYYKIY